MHNFFLNPNTGIFLKFLLAIILGAILGVQRNLSHKTAGMRTFSMVTLGSCLFIVISEVVGKGNGINFSDYLPMQVPAAIISSIGFLGAGLIIFKDDKINGLTTAAGLWVACGIGIAIGFDLYMMAVLATFFTFLIFTFLWRIEEKIKEISKQAVPNDSL